MHLTIDGFRANPEKLASEELVRALLEELPERIGMTKIAPPYVTKYVGSKPEDWGVSGFVLIAESHIAVHTFPERAHLWVDVFSCKAFDTALATTILAETFEFNIAVPATLKRGLEYPHVLDEAVPVADLERRLLTEAAGRELAVALEER